MGEEKGGGGVVRSVGEGSAKSLVRGGRKGRSTQSIFVGWRSRIVGSENDKKSVFELLGAGRGGHWFPGRVGRGGWGGGRQDYLPCKGLPGRSTPKAGSADYLLDVTVLGLRSSGPSAQLLVAKGYCRG